MQWRSAKAWRKALAAALLIAVLPLADLLASNPARAAGACALVPNEHDPSEVSCDGQSSARSLRMGT